MLLPRRLSPLYECLIAWHHMRKAVVISTMELHVLHLLVDVVALGEGVGGTPCFSIHCACLSELCRCVYTAWVHIQHITYWLPWLFVLMVSCCSPPPPPHLPPPTHTYSLAHALIGYTHWRGEGGLGRKRKRERLLYCILILATGMSVTRCQEAHRAS